MKIYNTCKSWIIRSRRIMTRVMQSLTQSLSSLAQSLSSSGLTRGSSIICISLCLTACGFHLRNASQIPAPLHTLNIQSDNPASLVAAALKDSLQGSNIKLTPTANYTLNISRSKFSHSENNITDTSSAENYAFSQQVTVTLTSNTPAKTIASQSFSASVTQLVNKNQILTPATTAAAHVELPRNLVAQIYNWLSSDDIAQGLYGKPQTPKKRLLSKQ